MWPVESRPTFQRNMSPPSSGSKNKPSKKPACLPPAFTLVSCLAYSSAMKMEATCPSETLVNFQWTTWHYIPKDRALRIIIAFMKK
jgi:hypothetical protein